MGRLRCGGGLLRKTPGRGRSSIRALLSLVVELLLDLARLCVQQNLFVPRIDADRLARDVCLASQYGASWCVSTSRDDLVTRWRTVAIWPMLELSAEFAKTSSGKIGCPAREFSWRELACFDFSAERSSPASFHVGGFDDRGCRMQPLKPQ